MSGGPAAATAMTSMASMSASAEVQCAALELLRNVCVRPSIRMTLLATQLAQQPQTPASPSSPRRVASFSFLGQTSPRLPQPSQSSSSSQQPVVLASDPHDVVAISLSLTALTNHAADAAVQRSGLAAFANIAASPAAHHLLLDAGLLPLVWAAMTTHVADAPLQAAALALVYNMTTSTGLLRELVTPALLHAVVAAADAHVGHAGVQV